MKKICMICVLVLYSSMAHAELSARRDSLRIYAFDLAHIPTAGNRTVSTAIGNRMVNLAIHQVCTDFPAIIKIDTVAIDSASEGGALASDFGQVLSVERIVASTSADSVRLGIQLVDPNTLRELLKTAEENRQTRQSEMSPRYGTVAGALLKVYPKWIRGDTAKFVVTYKAVDTTLGSDSAETSVLKDYLPMVLYFAAARLYEIERDPVWAKYYQDKYDKAKQ